MWARETWALATCLSTQTIFCRCCCNVRERARLDPYGWANSCRQPPDRGDVQASVASASAGLRASQGLEGQSRGDSRAMRQTDRVPVRPPRRTKGGGRKVGTCGAEDEMAVAPLNTAPLRPHFVAPPRTIADITAILD